MKRIQSTYIFIKPFLLTNAQIFLVISEGEIGAPPNTSSRLLSCPLKEIFIPPNAFLAMLVTPFPL